jgi:hypothetical protein
MITLPDPVTVTRNTLPTGNRMIADKAVPLGEEDNGTTYNFSRAQMLQWIEEGVLLTVSQAANLRGVTRQAINDLCRRGRIRFIQLEHGKLLWSEDLRNLVFQKPGRPRHTASNNVNARLELARRRKPIPPPPQPVKIREVVEVLEREVMRRTTAYPGKVASNQMTMQEAVLELAGIREALKLARARMVASGEKPNKLGFYREPVNSLRTPRLSSITKQAVEGREAKKARQKKTS